MTGRTANPIPRSLARRDTCDGLELSHLDTRTGPRYRRRCQAKACLRSSRASDGGVIGQLHSLPSSAGIEIESFPTSNGTESISSYMFSPLEIAEFPPIALETQQTAAKTPTADADVGQRLAGSSLRSSITELNRTTDRSFSPRFSEETHTISDNSTKDNRSEMSTPTQPSIENLKMRSSIRVSQERHDARDVDYGKRCLMTSDATESTRKNGLDVNGRFGMLGLLYVMKEANESFRLLSLGTDLENLGLDMDSPEPLYFTALLCDTDWEKLDNPPEVHNESSFFGRTQPNMARLTDEALFRIFYNAVGAVQESAAGELLNRNWCWHNEFGLWITRTPGSYPTAKTSASEKGTFTIFDPGKWAKVQWHGWIVYDSLEARPLSPFDTSLRTPNGNVAQLTAYPTPTESPAPIGLPVSSDAACGCGELETPYQDAAGYHKPQDFNQNVQSGPEAHNTRYWNVKTQQSHPLHRILEEQQQQQQPDSYFSGGDPFPNAALGAVANTLRLQQFSTTQHTAHAQQVKLQQLQQRWQWLHEQMRQYS